MSSKPEYFIDQQDALQRHLQVLQQQPSLAFDLEFDSHHHAYGVTLCLIQIATPEACYVIDPMVGLDLSGVYALFEDEGVEKIVHSPGEDLRLLHRAGCFPKHLFDTEIVAKLLNYEQTSLAALLQEQLGRTMSKQQQKSNWLRRPLSPEQIRYAADDVAWLHELKQALVAAAGPKGLLPFIEEEQAALSTTIYRTEVKENFLKPADKYNLSPYDQYVLNALLTYRDSLAQKINKPAFQVMAEEVVRALAADTLQPDDVLYEKGIHRNFKNERFADELAQKLEGFHRAAKKAGYSTSLPPREYFTPEQQAAREKANRDRVQKFVPVQQSLAATFGTHAARVILSTTAVNELLSKSSSLSGMKHNYRRELVQQTAQKLGIDLSDYA